MRQRQFGGPKLPKELRDKVDPAYQGKNGRRNYGLLNRKERRKAERSDKKSQRQQVKGHNVARYHRAGQESEDDDDDDDEILSQEESSPAKPTKRSQTESHKQPKGILKKSQPETKGERPRELSASPPPNVSRAVKDRLANDDAEIAALEKKLGIKGKKSKDGINDGLEDLFGDLGDLGSDDDFDAAKPSKRKRDHQDDEWLASKRRKALDHLEDSNEEEDNLEETEDSGSSIGDDAPAESGDDFENNEDFEEFDSEEDEFEQEVEPPKPRVRENPYVAPVTSDTPQLTTKYVPPALRGAPSSDAEALARLKRQMQGLLNRLSEANILTILRDVEQVFQNNARGYVNNTLIDLLMGLLADETSLLDTFLILHSGFITAVYKVIGTDFGAQMIERLVTDFDRHYQANKSGSGKQTTNLISVIAQLYSFQVIGSDLIFDYIKLFLGELCEINTELLLRIVKISGAQLRQDDPSSLKDIVLLLQQSVAKVDERTLSVRTKFMIETINSLKNNRMKTGLAASEIVAEHTTKMKKQLGTLNNRNLKGTEPLRIGLVDIKNTEKKGKWWLVGASWRNDMANATPTEKQSEGDTTVSASHTIGDDGEVDLLQLAREQRMNTDIRRAIFITIMSASDAKDAHLRLTKLNLKRAQEMEIPRVIVHCAGCEETYNHYYTLLARKFCADSRTRATFESTLYDVFKSLGEKKDDDGASDDEDERTASDVSLRKLVNLGKLYGTLMAKDGLPIKSLRNLNFAYLKTKTRTFIEILLVTVILQFNQGANGPYNEKGLNAVFVNADKAPQMIPGLQYFLKKVVSKTDIVASKAEKETVQSGCKAVTGMLTRLLATVKLDE